MNEQLANDKNGSSFSMRKIPVKLNEMQQDIPNDVAMDKIKILELSNFIDMWEQELLFSEKGFFSIKGKDIEGKVDEFVLDLEEFINSKIIEMKFLNADSKELAIKIKTEKISAIKNEMQIYEQQELKNWEFNVYESAIKASISRAVLYKSNDKIINSSLKNGLTVLDLMAEKENWSEKSHKYREDKYKSEFYSTLIDSLIQDKNPKAYLYFKKYKNNLQLDNAEKFEKAIKELKNNVIAYNWAKELFSYNISSTEQEKEIKIIKDKEIEKSVRKYLSDFSLSEKQEKEEDEKEKNIRNWQEITEIAASDINRAYLYIDFSASKENINCKKEYINKIKKQGYILTDKKQFISLLSEFFENFEKFKQKDISDYQGCFSKEDYNLFTSFKKMENSEFLKFNLDYKYVLKELEKVKINKEEDKYDLFQLLLSSKKEYKEINKKEPDLEARNKLVALALERFNKEHK